MALTLFLQETACQHTLHLLPAFILAVNCHECFLKHQTRTKAEEQVEMRQGVLLMPV